MLQISWVIDGSEDTHPVGEGDLVCHRDYYYTTSSLLHPFAWAMAAKRTTSGDNKKNSTGKAKQNIPTIVNNPFIKNIQCIHFVVLYWWGVVTSKPFFRPAAWPLANVTLQRRGVVSWVAIPVPHQHRNRRKEPRKRGSSDIPTLGSRSTGSVQSMY